MNSIQKEALQDFEELCSRNGLSPRPTSRFMCMNQLDVAIQKQRGAYTENMRQDWTELLYTCLAAPDRYFFKSLLHEKSITKFFSKLNSLIGAIEQERNNERAIYTYIKSVKAFFSNRNLSPLKEKNKNQYAIFLKESIYQALEQRMSKNPAFRNFADNYHKVLYDVFESKQQYLDKPIFFVFLPHYLFFELAKCEGLIKKDNLNAFSCFILGDDKPRWSIRNVPFVDGNIDPDQIISLYQLVETTLCEALQSQNYNSIGRELWLTNQELQTHSHDPEYYSEEKIRKELVEDAIDFSVPFWQYSAWGSIFCNAFFPRDSMQEESELQEKLEADIHELLSLEFRGTSQSLRRQREILEKYADNTVYLRRQEFRLSTLLEGICSIYSLKPFGEKGLEDTDLCNKVERLTGFLIACDRMPLCEIDASTEYQRLYLIREGHPYSSIEQKNADPFNMTRYLCCPSRILFNATFMRWNMVLLEKPKRYILTDMFPYSEPMKKLSNALYHALCSETVVLKDILVWGGVKVSLDDNHICSLTEAFHVWSIWHPDMADRYRNLEDELRRFPDILNRIAEGPEVIPSELIELDLSGYEFDQQMTYKLIKSKKWILECLGEAGKWFAPPKRLNDFQYVMILFYVFRALRDRMCQLAYDIYIY